MTATDVLGVEQEGDDREREIAELSGKLVVMDHRIQDAETKAADPDEESPETYHGLLKALHKSKKEAVRRLEESLTRGRPEIFTSDQGGAVNGDGLDESIGGGGDSGEQGWGGALPR